MITEKSLMALAPAAGIAEEMHWHGRAACQGRHKRGITDLWFPWGTGPEPPTRRNVQRRIRQAKRICHDECPVRLECLDFALRHNERYGIWGGLLPAERNLLRRRFTRRGAK